MFDGYVEWVLLNCCSPLTIYEAEEDLISPIPGNDPAMKPTPVVKPKPEPATMTFLEQELVIISVPRPQTTFRSIQESAIVAKSIPKPEAELWLIDLWTTKLVLSQVPTPNSLLFCRTYGIT